MSNSSSRYGSELEELHRIRTNVPEASARVIQVIEVIALRGCGVTFCTAPHEHGPLRRVTQYFDFEGNMLGESDPGHV